MVVQPIVALDVSSRPEADELLSVLGPACTFVKCGLQLFTAEGPDVVRWLRDRGKRVFLDLKLHDIPNTVATTVRAVRGLGAELLTVHAVGGRAMMRAAQDEAGDVRLLGVTVLTSLNDESLAEVWGRADVSALSDEVSRLAQLACAAGLAGVVSSVKEACMLRSVLGRDALIVTPGIRFSGAAAHDQARVATPADAAQAGATHIVVGRAVTAAPDPAAALGRVLHELGLADS